MALKVLLRRTIDGVGKVGEVVRVKPGYARNFLFPKAYAAIVSADSLRQIEKDKSAELVREKEMARKRELLVEKLKDLTITVEARAGEDGHLYGSVGARQVVTRLAEMGFVFEDRHVRFEQVRELGDYVVGLNLGGGVEVPVKLWVVQDAQDALAMREAAAEREAREAARAAAGHDDDTPDLDTVEF